MFIACINKWEYKIRNDLLKKEFLQFNQLSPAFCVAYSVAV